MELYIVKVEVPRLPLTWTLMRLADRRAEAMGFEKVSEAMAWAKKWGHEIVVLKPKGAR